MPSLAGSSRSWIRYSFDERIEDGLYCAAGLELLRTIIEEWDEPVPEPPL